MLISSTSRVSFLRHAKSLHVKISCKYPAADETVTTPHRLCIESYLEQKRLMEIGRGDGGRQYVRPTMRGFNGLALELTFGYLD